MQDWSKITFLKRYADDGIILFSVKDSSSLLTELRKLMLFYSSNLVINIIINNVTCQFLDLVLTLDDLTLTNGVIHYKTYFKKFH